MEDGNSEGNNRYGLSNCNCNNHAVREEEDFEKQDPEEEDNNVGEGGRLPQQRHCVDNKFDVDPVDILGNDNLDEPEELNFENSGKAGLGRNDVAANNQDVGCNQGLGA
jgi:hypothetical protein